MATFASTSYTFSSDSLLFQSLPKHPILTEVPSDLCDHHGPTSEPNYWQKLLLILLSDSLPFQSFPKRRIPYTEEIASNPCNQWSHIGAQLLTEVASNPCDHQALPSNPVCLLPSQMHLQGRTILLDFSMVSLDFSWFYLIFHVFSLFSIVNFSMVLLDFCMVLRDFSMVLLDFSMVLPFDSSLPTCTSEDGPGRNRYPTVTPPTAPNSVIL